MFKWPSRHCWGELRYPCVRPPVSAPGTMNEKGMRQTYVSRSKVYDTVCILAQLSIVKISSSCVHLRGEGPQVFYLKKKINKEATFKTKLCTHYANCSCIIHPHTCGFFRTEWQVVMPEKK